MKSRVVRPEQETMTHVNSDTRDRSHDTTRFLTCGTLDLRQLLRRRSTKLSLLSLHTAVYLVNTMDFVDIYSTVHLDLLELIGENTRVHINPSTRPSHKHPTQWSPPTSETPTNTGTQVERRRIHNHKPSTGIEKKMRPRERVTEQHKAPYRSCPQPQPYSSLNHQTSETPRKHGITRKHTQRNSGSRREHARPSNTSKHRKNSRFSERWSAISRLIRAGTGGGSQGATIVDGAYNLDDETLIAFEEDTQELESMNTKSAIHMSPTHNEHPRITKEKARSKPKVPSPLSNPLANPIKTQTPRRHDYRHRGYSQNALVYLRRFWFGKKILWDSWGEQGIFGSDKGKGKLRSLEEELLSAIGQMESEDIFGVDVYDELEVEDIELIENARDPEVRCPEVKSKTGSSSQRAVPPPLLPRMGDLKDLHYPANSSVDQLFAEYDTHTIAKINWVFDMNYRVNEVAESESPRHIRGCVTGSRLSWSSNDTNDSDSLYSSPNTSSSTLVCTSDSISLGDVIEGNVDFEAFSGSIRRQSSSHIRDTQEEGTHIPKLRRSLPWERSWVVRHDVLLNLIRVAADLASYKWDLDTVGPLEVARYIMTSSNVIFDPTLFQVGRDRRQSLEIDRSSASLSYLDNGNLFLRGSMSEGEDEDYGQLIGAENCRFRVGASMNPFTMFSTGDETMDEWSRAGGVGGSGIEISERLGASTDDEIGRMGWLLQ